jgi:hypothetical protein
MSFTFDEKSRLHLQSYIGGRFEYRLRNETLITWTTEDKDYQNDTILRVVALFELIPIHVRYVHALDLLTVLGRMGCTFDVTTGIVTY